MYILCIFYGVMYILYMCYTYCIDIIYSDNIYIKYTYGLLHICATLLNTVILVLVLIVNKNEYCY
jgi:hypothetical protein